MVVKNDARPHLETYGTGWCTSVLLGVCGKLFLILVDLFNCAYVALVGVVFYLRLASVLPLLSQRTSGPGARTMIRGMVAEETATKTTRITNLPQGQQGEAGEPVCRSCCSCMLKCKECLCSKDRREGEIRKGSVQR